LLLKNHPDYVNCELRPFSSPFCPTLPLGLHRKLRLGRALVRQNGRHGRL
jgi:hypothetical protein